MNCAKETALTQLLEKLSAVGLSLPELQPGLYRFLPGYSLCNVLNHSLPYGILNHNGGRGKTINYLGRLRGKLAY